MRCESISMDSTDVWPIRFQEIFSMACERYDSGKHSVWDCFRPLDVDWLAKQGCTAQELFDFVEDFCRYGEPDFETALEVAAIRREFFLTVLNGEWPGELPSATLPPKAQEVDGIAWLPRLIEKARRKLRGQMDADLMYGCGGDRSFFARTGIPAGEFLQKMWDCGEDAQEMVRFVKSRTATPV